MLTFVRPVGEAVSLQTAASQASYEGYRSLFVSSGTQALQCAIEQAKASSDASSPEVLLPAYACPDLVSACIGAGVTPRLVDLSVQQPFSNTEDILKQRTNNTVAVVLVNFLGVSPPPALFKVLRDEGLTIIEDRAQSFLPPEKANVLLGDYVIFSFGKGKPVSLLGGGLLLSRETSPAKALDLSESDEAVTFKFKLKVHVYNLVIRPFFYRLLLRVPGLSIGETHYKPPLTPTRLAKSKQALLKSNIALQHNTNTLAQDQLLELAKQYALGTLEPTTQDQRYLRFPLLAKSKQQRDAIINAMLQHGIGASSMYNRPLTDIPDTPLTAQDKNGVFPNATDFANRLFTLPCHSGVSQQVLIQIEKVLQNICTKVMHHPAKENGAKQ